MVKQAIRRLILRYFPELGERKHLPQLARIEAIYDLPTNGAKISTAFRPYLAIDIQLVDAQNLLPLDVPVFTQVTLATQQTSDNGLLNQPKPGMYCVVQYIDGLNSLPVITSILPWHSVVPEQKHTDVGLKQNARSQIKGSNGDWLIETDGKIEQTSDLSKVDARERHETYHVKHTTVASHDTNQIDGNQVNEIMGALKTIVGEKALLVALEDLLLGSKKQVSVKAHENMTLETLQTLHAKAAELAKVEGATVWLGNDSVNAVQILLELIQVVADTNEKIATHKHEVTKPPPMNAADFTGFKSEADGLKGQLEPVVG